MIRNFIRKVLRRRPVKAQKGGGKGVVLAAHRHGIHRGRISPAAFNVCDTLQRRGFQAFVVGGAVRDLLLGVTPKDFDVATNATPEEVRAAFRRSRIIGRRFRIVHVMQGREVIEVTTFRSGQEAKTDEHGRILQDNEFGTQAEDAMRRDFTANALYYDPLAEHIVDYHHGVADIEARVLRIIGNAATRYREDPVRMLRAVRLGAKLGLEIDEAVRAPIRELAPLLGNVPGARLLEEMIKLLQCGHALACVRQLRKEGLHHGLLPLLDVILEQPAGQRFVRIALENTDERVRAGKSVAPGFLFATLLWHEVLVVREARKAHVPVAQQAFFEAMDIVLGRQGDKLAITRRIATDIKDIWALQPRFARPARNARRLIHHPRYRAGWDFLRLRAEAGEIDSALPDWWHAFAHASEEERNQLMQNLPPGAKDNEGGRRRRRRRSRRRSARSEAQLDGQGAANGQGADTPVTPSGAPTPAAACEEA